MEPNVSVDDSAVELREVRHNSAAADAATATAASAQSQPAVPLFDAPYVLVSAETRGDQGRTRTRFWLAGDDAADTPGDELDLCEKCDSDGVQTLSVVASASRLAQTVLDDIQSYTTVAMKRTGKPTAAATQQQTRGAGFRDVYSAVNRCINAYSLVLSVNGEVYKTADTAHAAIVEALTRPHTAGQQIASAASSAAMVLGAASRHVASWIGGVVATTSSDEPAAIASPPAAAPTSLTITDTADALAQWSILLAHPAAHHVPQATLKSHTGTASIVFETTADVTVRPAPVRVDIICGNYPAPTLVVRSRQGHRLERRNAAASPQQRSPRIEACVSFEAQLVGPLQTATALRDTTVAVELEVSSAPTP